MKKVICSIAWVLAAALIYGCGCRQTPPALSSETRIAIELANKVDSWRARRRAECLSRALAAAQLRADSMIMDYAYEQRMMLDRPARPVRPDEPELLRPSDTLKLAPFLGDSL